MTPNRNQSASSNTKSPSPIGVGSIGSSSSHLSRSFSGSLLQTPKQHLQTLNSPIKEKLFEGMFPEDKPLPLYIRERACKDAVNTPENIPVPKYEQQALTQTAKRMFHGTEKTFIECPTGGQPLRLGKLQKARRPSDQVKTPEKRRRAKNLNTVREILAGTRESREAIIQQMGTEMKQLPMEIRLDVAAFAGIQGGFVTAELALTIKSNVGLSWDQQKRLMRFLTSSLGVKVILLLASISCLM